MNIIVKTTITTTSGDLLHESTQVVRTDAPLTAPPTPQWVPSYIFSGDPIGTSGTSSTLTFLPGETNNHIGSVEPEATPVKRKPGRPRKNPLPDPNIPKRKPGRPRKVTPPEG